MSNVERSESLKELATAMAAAQGEIGNAAKSSVNPHFKSKYADLAEILNTAKPVLSKHGLSIVQMPGYGDGVVTLTTMLMHSSGEFIQSECSAPISKQDAQQVGSALTYLRRYSLAAFCGIAQEDDDGNAASKAAANQSRPANNTKPAYPEADFSKNLPAWRDLIESGKKTSDQIIGMIESKGTLTNQMKAAISAKQEVAA